MKDIKILEDDKTRTMSDVRRIITRLDNGTQVWIPEDECVKYGKYITLTVTKEGTFTAPIDSSDGFIKVIVNIPKTTSVTGTENGVEMVYTVNEEGYLISEEVT